MMARSTIAPRQRPDTLMQLSRSLILEAILYRAAGPYILARSCRAGHGGSRHCDLNAGCCSYRGLDRDAGRLKGPLWNLRLVIKRRFQPTLFL
jgi:hypothetical protein